VISSFSSFCAKRRRRRRRSLLRVFVFTAPTAAAARKKCPERRHESIQHLLNPSLLRSTDACWQVQLGAPLSSVALLFLLLFFFGAFEAV
jgi:hypothetical protein